MAKIPEYTSQVGAQGQLNVQQLSASDIAPSAGIEKLGGTVQEHAELLQQHANREDVANTSASAASLQAYHLQKMQDDSTAGKFNVSDALTNAQKDFDDVTEGTSTAAGKNYATKTSARMMADLSRAAHTIQAKVDGEKQVNHYKTSLSGLSQAALQNPGSYQSQLQNHDEALAHLPPKVAEAMRVSGNKQIEKSAAIGFINDNTTMGRSMIKSGAFKSLDGTEVEALYQHANVVDSANELAMKRAQKATDDQLGQQQMQVKDKMVDSIVKGDFDPMSVTRGEGTILDPNDKMSIVNWAHKMTTDKFKGDPGVEEEVRQRIHLPDGDPEKIINENDLFHIDGLGGAGLSRMRKEIQTRRTDDGSLLESDMKNTVFNSAKNTLVKGNPMMGIKDPSGEENFAKFKIFAAKYIDDERKKGTPLAELTTPGSKKYVGQYVSSFARTPQQIMKDMTNQIHGTPQTLPNEVDTNIGVQGTPPPPANNDFAAAAAAEIARRKGKK